MRIVSLTRVDNAEYVIEIECAPEVTERFSLEVSSGVIGGPLGKLGYAVCGDARFCARVQDGMTRRDIYKLVSQMHTLEVAYPPADVQLSQLGGNRFRVEGGPLVGLEIGRIPENPTPEEEARIRQAGIAFIMGEPPPEE